MANYIHALQESVREHHADKGRAAEVIDYFMEYLHSSKFWDDTTIQTIEVVKVLQRIKSELDIARPDCMNP